VYCSIFVHSIDRTMPSRPDPNGPAPVQNESSTAHSPSDVSLVTLQQPQHHEHGDQSPRPRQWRTKPRTEIEQGVGRAIARLDQIIG
jgi:hypothetical protein